MQQSGPAIWSEVVYHWLQNTFGHHPTPMTDKEKEHDH